ncbi:hypothetical protein KRR38_34630 [Novosphingobium sp. G106]|uniref:hypothetical protein n=1 Tax=Novosphingobium sp. G106 TaxID=2849500 RepID=UPI001C2DCDD2|nr:hypothetical protein [Novosphingobium sp. G106]MBV1692630.1 hypothetical protein [Novosphingobium sp. G106]
MESAAEWLLALPPCFTVQREAMIEALRERMGWLVDLVGKETLEVGLAAMAQIPREEFVIPLIEEFAYLPMSLDIGFNQTISHPQLVLK